MLIQHRQMHRQKRSALPLSLVSKGETAVISQIRGGRRMRQRLLDLGMNQGARIRVIKNEMPGPLIVAVKEDGRLALGRGMSHHIIVTMDVKNNKLEGT